MAEAFAEFIEKDTAGPYALLANQSLSTFEARGKSWPSVEHYFQASKFLGTEHEEAIRTTPDPWNAHKLGRSRKYPLRKDWEEVKGSVMLEALRAKYSQNQNLRALLVSTSPKTIVYRSHNDTYWGKTAKDEGANQLGEMLRQIRTEVRTRPSLASIVVVI